MKLAVLFFVFSVLSFAVNQPPVSQPSPQPIVLKRSIPVVEVLPDGKLELKEKASWEEAAYALLEIAKNLDASNITCKAELEKYTTPKKAVKK